MSVHVPRGALSPSPGAESRNSRPAVVALLALTVAAASATMCRTSDTKTDRPQERKIAALTGDTPKPADAPSPEAQTEDGGQDVALQKAFPAPIESTEPPPSIPFDADFSLSRAFKSNDYVREWIRKYSDARDAIAPDDAGGERERCDDMLRKLEDLLICR